jgi:hypothetical protein
MIQPKDRGLKMCFFCGWDLVEQVVRQSFVFGVMGDVLVLFGVADICAKYSWLRTMAMRFTLQF